MGFIAGVIKYGSNFSHLLPIYAGKRDKPVLWWYALTALGFDLTSMFLKQFAKGLPGQGNLFLLIEFLFISFYYKRFLNKKYVSLLSGLLVTFFIIHTFFFRTELNFSDFSILKLNLFGGSVFYLAYIVFAIAGLHKIIKQLTPDFIEHSSFFWVNVAFLVYASGVFFIFLFAQIIEVQDYNMISLLWNYLFCSLNIIKNIFLAKALAVDNGSVKR